MISVITPKSTVVKTKHFSVISVVSQKSTVVKTKHYSVISAVSQQNTVVKTKHFSVISVVSQQNTVVKTKHFSVVSVVSQQNTVVKNQNTFQWFRWLVNKIRWLKPNTFQWFRWLVKKSTPKRNGLRWEANFSLGRRSKTVKKAERTSPKGRRGGKNFWYSKKWQKRQE